jgi:chromosome partitioning protein
VVPGGPALWDVAPAFTARGARGASLPGLRPALERVRPARARTVRGSTERERTEREASAHSKTDYDLVLVDTPPGEPILQELVFAAADFLIIPSRSDEASLDGLVVVAQRFAAARAVNPGLTLLGVVLFGARAGSTRLHARVRSALEETLGGAAPVFDSSIRYLESAAVDMRSRGLLPYELRAAHEKQTPARIDRLRTGAPGRGEPLLSRDSSVARLADDYAVLADEVLVAMATRRDATRREVAV